MVSFADMWSYVEDKALSRRCPGFASNASHGSPQPPQPLFSPVPTKRGQNTNIMGGFGCRWISY